MEIKIDNSEVIDYDTASKMLGCCFSSVEKYVLAANVKTYYLHKMLLKKSDIETIHQAMSDKKRDNRGRKFRKGN